MTTLDKQEKILAIYKMATPEEKRDGIVWYANALSVCSRMSITYNVPLHIVTGVVARLSPNNNWKRNLINADAMLKAKIAGEDINSFKVSTYPSNKKLAWEMLDLNKDGNFMDYPQTIAHLNGQKIQSFCGNIMGDDGCTIDGHARNIAYGERVGLTSGKINIGKKEYRELQEAYVQACKRTRVNGRALKAFELQAITWVAWRRIHNIK